MLRPVKMKKVKAIVPIKYKDELCLSLHKLGAIHVNDISKRVTDAEWKHILCAKVPSESKVKFSDYLKRLSVVDSLFQNTYSESGGRHFSRNTGARIRVNYSHDGAVSRDIDELLGSVESRASEIDECITKLREDEKELCRRKKILEMLSGIDSRLDEFYASTNFTSMLFKIDIHDFDAARARLKSIDKIVLETEKDGDGLIVLIIYPREIENEVARTLNGLDIDKIDVPRISCKPKDEINRIRKKITSVRCEKMCHEKEMYALSSKYAKSVVALREEAQIIVDRYSLLDKCSATESSFVLEFFVPERRESEVIKKIVEATKRRAIIYSVEPMTEEAANKVPVMLDNPALVKPFEGLVTMYSVPKYNDFDPTILIAPAMMLFFGIMLNDVGYGVLVALAGFLFYRHYRTVYDGARNTGMMLVLLGISSVFFGIISGGYFGDALRRVLPNRFYLIDPLGDSNIAFFGTPVDNPILAVLVFSLVVGVAYVNIGYVFGIADCLNKIKAERHRKKKVQALEQEIMGHAAMIVFQLGLFGFVSYWKLGWFRDVQYFIPADGLVILVSVAMLAKSGGIRTLFGFFDVTGFIGDDLSFIRLLALCLATEGIANIVNMFVGFSFNIPYAGVALGAIIFVFGHMFNLVVGALGAGIHSLRLQYVEFFSKFYEGGGVEFAPYYVNRKKTVLVES